MAKITLNNVKHSYLDNPVDDVDWALKHVDLTWQNGGAYALLGPSGCGKTTMLNLISGLLTPTEGRILFDDEDVTTLPADQRHLAQVFQFPVVYDTMTVFDNLAFPLKNRGTSPEQIRERVTEIARMLELEEELNKRASRLTADGKQKISLGRGLVRSDVNVIMFDEPLTVIDPHLKWQLRSKLKELQQQVGTTMIYVTHDQTEALTFADQVAVMLEGEVLQTGTPTDLFEKPMHTFVGHFIGSPGMNVLPCTVDNGTPIFANNPVSSANSSRLAQVAIKTEIGVRPEFVSFSAEGIPVDVVKVDDVGRYQIVEVQHERHSIKIILQEGQSPPSEGAKINFDPDKTYLYADEHLAA